MAQPAKVAKAEPEAPIPSGRTMKAVDPAFVVVNHAGFGWRDLMVRLPEGAIADDLKEPSLWSRVQNERNFALRKHDHLYIVAFDERWAAEAIVTHASAREAVISKPRLVAFDERVKPFYNDGTYAVAWYGNGYAVKRMADGHRMTDVVTTEAMAERDLARLYPRPV
jgi:hypothetical protein